MMIDIDTRTLAYHEAGHAVVALRYVGYASITLESHGMQEARCNYWPLPSAEATAQVAMAGPIAEMIIRGDSEITLKRLRRDPEWRWCGRWAGDAATLRRSGVRGESAQRAFDATVEYLREHWDDVVEYGDAAATDGYLRIHGDLWSYEEEMRQFERSIGLH